LEDPAAPRPRRNPVGDPNASTRPVDGPSAPTRLRDGVDSPSVRPRSTPDGDASPASPRSSIPGNPLQIVDLACFVAGTPILVPGGEKRVEELRVGDLILSRPEGDPEVPARASFVDAVFELTAPILELRVGGQLIQTTAEHPFYVAGVGWVAANLLKQGDPLLGHDGQVTLVDSVELTETIASVYNLRVAEDHTYFVGSSSWGFSVWVHNTYRPVQDYDGTWYVEYFDAGGTTHRVTRDPLTPHEAKARADLFNQGVAPLRSDLADHIRFRDTTVDRKNGIGGAHNLDEFNAAAKAENILITNRTPHPTLAGIEKISYQIPALDAAGNPTGGYKAKVFEKTVYDPRVISDDEMLRLGQEAANDALSRGALTREWTGTASNGLRFRGYLDDTGYVRSFFPDF
jgi:hypothetical protein